MNDGPTMWKKRAHFISRVMDRFGVRVDNDDVSYITDSIVSFNSKPIKILDDGDSFHVFEFSDIEMVVLFNWDFNVPVTAYYPSWFKEMQDGLYDFKIKNNSKYVRRRSRRVNIENRNHN
jgi:hypothetical protein